MTDYRTIKLSDIESLQSFDASFEGGVIESEQGQYVLLSDICALLDKAPSVEPVAEIVEDEFFDGVIKMIKPLKELRSGTKLYTSPPQAEALHDLIILMKPDERLALIHSLMEGYCKECGVEDTEGRCQCWNDD